MNNGLTEDDPSAGMMKSMNIVMPNMMGVITINVPIAPWYILDAFKPLLSPSDLGNV